MDIEPRHKIAGDDEDTQARSPFGARTWVDLNGRLVLAREATVSVFDRGLMYGDGLFETLRAYDGVIFRLAAHLTRLKRAAALLAMPLPPTAVLTERLYATLAKNDLRDALLRLTVTRGVGSGWTDPLSCRSATWFITPRAFDADHAQAGISAVILTLPRHPPQIPGAMVKSTSFINNVLGRIEAARHGAHEGLFLSANGYLAEGTTSNLFWVRRGALVTPSEAVGLLPGITRAVVTQIALRAGIPVRTGRYRPAALAQADEAFLTHSGVGVLPLICLNGRPVGDGGIGPITRRLRVLYQQQVRRECGRARQIYPRGKGAEDPRRDRT